MHVVCRVHDGENAKARPAFYAKEAALASLVRAAAAAGAPVEFLTDGPVRPSLARLMDEAGTVTPIAGGSARRSFRAMVAYAARTAGGDDDLVWFSEDDYLYRQDALVQAAAVLRPGVDYVTPAAAACLDTAASRWRPRARPSPGAAQEPMPVTVGDVTWFRAVATTSTFGVRRSVLREDARTLRACPFAGGAWDTTTSFVLQGLRPFTAADLLGTVGSRVRGGTERAEGRDHAVREHPARVAVRAGVRACLTLLALRPASHRRVLLGADPEIARHLEVDALRSDEPSPATRATDWEALAAQTRAWAGARGWVTGVD